MTLSPPRFEMAPTPRLGRWQRVWAMVAVNFRLRAFRPLPIIIMVLGFVIITLSLLVTVLIRDVLGGGTSLHLSDFYAPYGGGLGILLLITTILMSALVGGGIIADDLGNGSISLYRSRPIESIDYLIAKVGVVALSLGLVIVVPGLLAVLVTYVLGYASGTVALEALGGYLAVGLLLTLSFSIITTFLSSLTHRRRFASAGIFAILLMDEILVVLLDGATNSAAWLYFSPWEDLLAIARAIFGSTLARGVQTILPWGAVAVLLTIIVGLGAVTYFRIDRMEVVTE